VFFRYEKGTPAALTLRSRQRRVPDSSTVATRLTPRGGPAASLLALAVALRFTLGLGRGLRTLAGLLAHLVGLVRSEGLDPVGERQVALRVEVLEDLVDIRLAHAGGDLVLAALDVEDREPTKHVSQRADLARAPHVVGDSVGLERAGRELTRVDELVGLGVVDGALDKGLRRGTIAVDRDHSGADQLRDLDRGLCGGETGVGAAVVVELGLVRLGLSLLGLDLGDERLGGVLVVNPAAVAPDHAVVVGLLEASRLGGLVVLANGAASGAEREGAHEHEAHRSGVAHLNSPLAYFSL
jgi:hypothetical protein